MPLGGLIAEIRLRLRPQGRAHGGGDVVIRLKAARADAGADGGQEIGGVRAAVLRHGPDGLCQDAPGTAPPPGVDGGDGGVDGVVEEDHAAVGGENGEGQAGNVRHQGVHVPVVPGAGEALAGVLRRDAAKVRGVDLLAEDGLLRLRPQNGAETAVVLPDVFRGVAPAGAQVQAVPGGGGDPAGAGGKAVGQGGEQLRAEDGEPGFPMEGDGHRMLLSEKGPPLPSGRRTGAGFFL